MILASEPYLYYRPRVNDAVIEDVSGNGRHGRRETGVLSAQALTLARLQQVRAFNREVRYITAGDSLAELASTLHRGFSFEAIVRTIAREEEGGALFSILNGPAVLEGDRTSLQVTVREYPSEDIRVFVRDRDGTSASGHFSEEHLTSKPDGAYVNLFDGLHHHLVATYDGSVNPTPGSFQIIIDGMPHPIDLLIQGPPTGLADMGRFEPDRARFGVAGRGTELKFPLDGMLEEIALYNRVLPEAEARAHYREYLRTR